MQQNLRNKVTGEDFLQSFYERELNKDFRTGPGSNKIKQYGVPKGDTEICKVQCIIYKNVSNVESNLSQVKTSGIYKSNLHNRGVLIDRTKEYILHLRIFYGGLFREKAA